MISRLSLSAAIVSVIAAALLTFTASAEQGPEVAAAEAVRQIRIIELPPVVVVARLDRTAK